MFNFTKTIAGSINNSFKGARSCYMVGYMCMTLSFTFILYNLQRALYGHIVEGETQLIELPTCKKICFYLIQVLLCCLVVIHHKSLLIKDVAVNKARVLET